MYSYHTFTSPLNKGEMKHTENFGDLPFPLILPWEKFSTLSIPSHFSKLRPMDCFILLKHEADNYSESPTVNQFSSVQFSLSVVSDSLRPHESQHARPPCPSPTPRIYPNSCPSSRWCHPAISSSAIPFSSCPQSHPALESFPMSQLFTWGGQSIGVSALAKGNYLYIKPFMQI